MTYDVSSGKLNSTIPYHTKRYGSIPTGTPKRGHLMQGWYEKITIFLPISRYISKTIQDTDIVNTECIQETLPKLSNGTIFNDFNLDFKVTIFLNIK